MAGIPRAHLGRAPLPAGDDLGAALNRLAVVEAEVALLLAHGAPVRRVRWRRHAEISLSRWPRAFPLCRKMFYRTRSIRYQAEAKRGRHHWPDQELVRATACAIVDKLNAGEVTPLDLLDVLEHRIAEVDGKVNALPTLCFDRARIHARALMQKPAGRARPARRPADPDQGPHRCRGRADHAGLADLPGHIPARSDILVEHLEANGGVIYAKSNTPEFGAGANTFNEVFGATLQSLGHVAIRRRLLRRRGGRARHRHGLARARLRHGRQPAQPRELLRHRRAAAEHRARRAYAGIQDRPQSRRAGPDGAQRRGSRAAARCHERRASGRSAVAAAAAGIIPLRRALRQGPEARRLFARSRHHAGRSRSRRHHPQGGAALRGSRRHRRGGASRSARGP